MARPPVTWVSVRQSKTGVYKRSIEDRKVRTELASWVDPLAMAGILRSLLPPPLRCLLPMPPAKLAAWRSSHGLPSDKDQTWLNCSVVFFKLCMLSARSR